MRFRDEPGLMLYAAAEDGSCARCGAYLPRGLPVLLLAPGWGCFECSLDEQVIWHSRRIAELLPAFVEEEELLRRPPDDCSRPARRLDKPAA